MRRTALIITCLVPLAALGACGRPAQRAVPSAPPAPTTTPASAPSRPEPAKAAACPYLDASTVADANGQRVTAVKVSADDPPACFFYTYHGALQMSVWVYQGTRKVAGAIIDRAAPVAASNKAAEPDGWTGGSEVTDSGAVYAVLSGGAAVVVRTNQQQTVKAREIAADTISALHL
jgi:hypothetical protein